MSLWLINEFHIQLLALELLLCKNLPRKRSFLLRLLPLSGIYVALPAIIPNGFLTPVLRIGDWFTVSFLLVLLLSSLLIWFSFEISVKQLVLCCCVAHTLQHMTHCLSHVAWHLFSMGQILAQITELMIMLCVLMLVYVFLKKDRLFGIETANIRSNQLVTFAAVSTLVVYFISFWSSWNEGETVGEQFFDFLSCLLLLVILLDLFRFRRSEEEHMILKQLLRQEEEQHKMSCATIEVINRKCHDLKHQISALRNMSQKEREKNISELEKAILLYDNLPKTGSDDLDIVLAEKVFLAEKQGVQLRSIADGKMLSFMSAEDICSLFGNAIDNAIESAAEDPCPESRIITLQTFVKGNIFTIHVDNPCKEQPTFLDGIPLTRKPDTDYHGFGMRSMRYVAEKYGGTLTTSWEHGVFSLDVLFLLS